MFIKYKLFLLCAKWIPVVTAIGILVTNTITYYGCNDIVVDIFNFNIGTSVAGVILMYVCSYAFNFCLWHKLVITYNALIIAIVFIIRYCITECSYSYLLLSYYILAGIILLLILYIHSKKYIFIDVYVALNAQYHDNIELYKEWFGEDNIENIKDKIIESAIVN